MSSTQSKFIKWLAGILILPTLVGIINIIGMFFGEKELRKTVEDTAKNVDYIIKYYPSYDDFTQFMTNTRELYDARIEGNKEKIERVETELDDFRNQFGIKTRGQRETD